MPFPKTPNKQYYEGELGKVISFKQGSKDGGFVDIISGCFGQCMQMLVVLGAVRNGVGYRVDQAW